VFSFGFQLLAYIYKKVNFFHSPFIPPVPSGLGLEGIVVEWTEVQPGSQQDLGSNHSPARPGFMNLLKYLFSSLIK
jgi:hypothetical protein